ncbi:MAG: HAD-IA family hydrolase [Actinomycetaceae bacterium]|nr:HAD-IA family hydrolase [Actinomycetaceae bacterium]
MRVLLFDLYGLFIPVQTREGFEAIARSVGVDADALLPLYLGQNRRDYDAGVLDARGLWDRIGRALGVEIDWRVALKQDLASWSGRNEQMVDYVRQLHETGTPMALLSNIPAEFARQVRAEQPWIEECFDPVLLSCEIGLAKPEAPMFATALRLLRERFGEGLDAADVLFTDDSRANIDAAAACGLTVHHFQGIDGLRDAVTAHLG